MKKLALISILVFTHIFCKAVSHQQEHKFFQDCLANHTYKLESRADSLLFKANCLMRWAQNDSRFRNGLSYVQDVNPLLGEVTDSMLLMGFFYQRAVLHHYLSQYKAATTDYKAYIKYHTRKNHLEQEVQGLISLAETQRAAHQFSMARFFLNQVLDKDTLEQNISAKSLSRLWHRYAAIVHEESADYQKVIEYSHRSLEYSLPNGLEEEAATAYLELGLAYFNLQNPEMAEEFFLKALAINEKNGHLHAVGSTLKNLIQLHYHSKDFEKAESYWKRAFQLSNKYQFNGLLYELYHLRAQYFESIVDYKNAYVFGDSSHRIKERYLQGTFDREMVDLSKNYQNEIAIQKLTNSEIKREKALQEALAEKQLRNLVIAILVLTMAVLAMLIFYYRQAQIANKELITKGKIIESQYDSLAQVVEQKQALIQEVHHRVKNNLQIVMSILNMQHHKESSAEVKDSIGRTLKRIKSISLIHDRLYRNESLSRIQFKDYVNELVHYLQQAVTSEKQNITFKVNFESIQLDIEKAIPLGLLINEIVTNAIKYAFPQGNSGVISISLRKVEQNVFELLVADNGVGFEKSENTEGSRFGTDLINMLTRQIKGSLKVNSSNGTQYCISFKAIENDQ